MLKRVYSKYKDEQEVFKLDKEYTLKEMLSLFAIPKAKIGWKGQKRKFKVIARNDNFIIIARPYNPKKTFEYSILDLEYMVCNHDNYYCKYDYANEKECIKALRELQETRDEEKKTNISSDCGLQLSRRGIAKIEDMVSEVWINVDFRRLSNHEKDV